VSPFRLCVLASGNGTNLQAILDQLHGAAAEQGGRVIEVAGVGSDKADAGALERARAAGVETAVFAGEDYEDREARDEALARWIEGLEADLVVLAGYMQLLSPGFVARFPNRVVNVHPALLPSFPGLDAVGQALEYGVRTTGVSVHFVDEGVDSGPVILQAPVTVPADRDRDALEEEIHRTEHSLYPQAIRMIAEGRVRIDRRNPRLVLIDE
jgi:phosphoribosylglycinamide formyltransferase-1